MLTILVYKGPGALPHFNTEGECKLWCNNNPTKSKILWPKI